MPDQTPYLVSTETNDAIRCFQQRWAEIVVILPNLASVQVYAEEGYSPHFEQPRGYAVTRGEPGAWTVVFAPKTRTLPLANIEALVRHEIGHILDFSIPTEALNALARVRDFDLPSTPERRADALAELVWGERIYYDASLVQTTEKGVYPRPDALGL